MGGEELDSVRQVRRAVALLAVVVLAALTSCESGQACTSVGRASTISINISRVVADQPDDLRGRVCVNTTCNAIRSRDHHHPDVVFVDDPSIENVGPVHVVLSIDTESGRPLFDDEADVALIRRQPNGPDCPPTFYSAALVAVPGTGLRPSM